MRLVSAYILCAETEGYTTIYTNGLFTQTFFVFVVNQLIRSLLDKKIKHSYINVFFSPNIL